MNKKLKHVFIFLIIASVIVIAVLLVKITSRVPENPTDYTGNTAGNLYNRGLFAEDDNYIYFANIADSYRLYRTTHDLTDTVRLNKDSVEYINPDASSTYLYYSRINYRQNTNGNTVFDLLDSGIYRFNLKNEGLSRLYTETCGMVLLGGNNLYYQTHGSDGNYDFYSLTVNENDAKARLITNDYILPANYQNGLLYYSGVTEDLGLYSMNPDTGSSSRFADVDCFRPIITDSGIFFLSLKYEYALFYLPHNSDTATSITNERVSSYNISKDGRTLFYQIDGGDNNRLCRYDITTGQETELLRGNFSNLNTVSDYLFFTDFEEATCYCYDISNSSLSQFMPTAE
ncbi:MAG: DUF5050 domain-containing protein [Lachnospiraceae bacterium]|nr:DUF5050 domain-containing protein [Lachnospiraceae bacterium]